MVYELYKSPTQLAAFVVLLLFIPLGIAVTALRFVATYRSPRKPGLEDWMAILATLFFFLTIVKINGGDISVQAIESPYNYELMRKWDMAAVYSYVFHALFVKLSVLALYYRIFGIQHIYRAWIIALGACQLVLVTATCVFQALQCRPISRYWDRRVPGKCTSEGVLILGGEIPNSLVDFAMVALAMVMIRSLQLPRGTKLKLHFLFGLGALVGVIGFVKIAVTYSTSTFFSFSMLAILNCVQMFASLLCCSLPVLNRIFPAADFWRRLSSQITEHATLNRVARQRRTKEINKQFHPVGKDTGGFGPKHNDQALGRRTYGDDSTYDLVWSGPPHQKKTHVTSCIDRAPKHLGKTGTRKDREFEAVWLRRSSDGDDDGQGSHARMV